MANRSMLLGLNSKELDLSCFDGNEDILAAASYCIPLFWFGMFAEEDIERNGSITQAILPENRNHAASLLCGYSWIRQVPWEEE